MSWDTKRGQILDALMTRVKAMSIATGYHYDVQDSSVQCEPVNILLIPGTALPFFLVELSPGNREYQNANQVEIFNRFVVTYRVDVAGTDPQRKVQAGENLLGDLERTFQVDITLGGLVFDLRMEEPDGPMVGLGSDTKVVGLVELVAHHHREYGLP